MTEEVADINEDYEFFDYSALASMTISEPPDSTPWIKPEDIKLKHRIGRGSFGDVWLATLHSSSDDFDEFHEVAAKTLSFLKDEEVPDFLSKFYHVFQRCRRLKRVSWPQGISRKNGKVCVITKFYEGSLGDRMARLKGNRLSLPDVLKYGLNLAYAILELHSVGIMALNLKPCNYLLDDQDNVILGEFGIPMLLLGCSFRDYEEVVWLGTPNYMSPEQWNPQVLGPLSFASDSWGFACSIIEMITGVKPWSNCSPEEIFSRVVKKKEKPQVPNELPSAIQNVIRRCFEYDQRNRPSISEITQAFESPEMMFKEGDWVLVKDRSALKTAVVKTVMDSESLVLQYFDKKNEFMNNLDVINKLSLWKHSFEVGNLVQLKESPLPKDFSEVHEPIRTEGSVIAIDKKAGNILVKFSESQEAVEISPMAIERVSMGFVVGDLVKLRGGRHSDAASVSTYCPSSVGMVHAIDTNGKLKVAFLGLEMLQTCNPRELEKVKPFCVGQFIKIKNEIASPRFQWPLRKDRSWDTGKIIYIAPNGGLVVRFPRHIWNWDEWWADPDEVKIVSLNDYDGWVDKYHHLESMHWSVRPAMLSLAAVVALKLGAGIICALHMGGKGKNTNREKKEARIEHNVDGVNQGKNNNPGNSSWLPSSVANVLFSKGMPALH